MIPPFTSIYQPSSSPFNSRQSPSPPMSSNTQAHNRMDRLSTTDLFSPLGASQSSNSANPITLNSIASKNQPWLPLSTSFDRSGRELTASQEDYYADAGEEKESDGTGDDVDSLGLYDYTKSMRTPSVSPTRRYHQNTSTDCFDTPPPPTLSYSPTPSLNSHSPTTPTNFESISRSRYGAVTRQNNYLTSPVPGPIQISTTLAADVQFDPVVGSPSTLSRHSSQGSGADQGNKMMMASFPHKITVSRNDIATRYVLVGNIPSSATRVELEHIFARPFGASGIFDGHLVSNGFIVLVFHDVRDAVHAIPMIINQTSSSHGISFAAHCITRGDVKNLMDHQIDHLLSASEGVIIISIRGPDQPFPYSLSSLRTLLETFGKIRSFRTVEGESIQVVEYYDEREADNARAAWNGYIIYGHEFMCEFEPDVATTVPFAITPVPSTQLQAPIQLQAKRTPQPVSRFITPADIRAIQDQSSRHSSALQPISNRTQGIRTEGVKKKRSKWADDEVSLIDQSQIQNQNQNLWPAQSRSTTSSAFMKPSIRSPRSIYDTSVMSSLSSSNGKQFGIYRDETIPPSNVLDFDRIERGLEHRSTLMIRNIPNRLDADQLMAMITEVVPNSFDFFYLRIDFSNSCNVGYAFVNFIDIESLYTWTKARVGTRWNCFASDKVVVASFANVQGKEALITKFRSSSVMDEIPAFRPRLFHSAGPFQGQPESFPVCDNPRKKARSLANVNAIGLFPSQKPVFKLTQCLSNLHM